MTLTRTLLLLLSFAALTLAYADTPNEFYGQRRNDPREELHLESEKAAFERKVKQADAEIGIVGGAGAFDFSLFHAGAFYPNVDAFFGGALFGSVKLVPGIYECLEIGLYRQQGTASAVVNRVDENTFDQVIAHRSSALFALAYLIKFRFAHISILPDNRAMRYTQYWLGAGPIGLWYFGNERHTKEYYENAVLTNSIPGDVIKQNALRFGIEAIAGISFSLKESPYTFGLQFKYARLLAAIDNEFYSTRYLESANQLFSLEVFAAYNFWDG